MQCDGCLKNRSSKTRQSLTHIYTNTRIDNKRINIQVISSAVNKLCFYDSLNSDSGSVWCNKFLLQRSYRIFNPTMLIKSLDSLHLCVDIMLERMVLSSDVISALHSNKIEITFTIAMQLRSIIDRFYLNEQKSNEIFRKERICVLQIFASVEFHLGFL